MSPDPWEFGWDALVAIGTLALACVTFFLALFTARMASKTSALATETAEDVRSGVRPALIDAAGQAAPEMEFGGRTMDGFKDYGWLKVAVRNAGRGPALNVYGYAFIATKASSNLTRLVTVGNVAPEESTTVEMDITPNVDTSGSTESYLALRVVLVYSDLAGRRYHTVIRLSDPGKGRSRRYDTTHWEALTQDGTEIGEGEAPLPQWRVTFVGTLTPDQEARLRANGVQLISSHATGTAGSPAQIPADPSPRSYSVFTSAQTRSQAIKRVVSALGDEGTYGRFDADLWTSQPFDLPPETSS
jgi:hypothetical protein